MTSTTGKVVAGAVLVIGCAATAVMIARRDPPPPPRAAQARAEAPPIAPPQAEIEPAAPEAIVASPPATPSNAVAQPELASPPAAPAESHVSATPARRTPPPPLQSAAPTGEPPRVPLPIAREAMRLVGVDAAAEAVWMEAINDPNLDAEDRSDLIEDLNEEGFMNPDNVSRNELQLVINRLRLIEKLSPGAMDEVNAAAFKEAYKDLMNIYTRLIG